MNEVWTEQDEANERERMRREAALKPGKVAEGIGILIVLLIVTIAIIGGSVNSTPRPTATMTAWETRNNDYLNDERGTYYCTPFGC